MGPYGADEAAPPLGARTRTCVVYRRFHGAIFGFEVRKGLGLLFRTPPLPF